MLRNFQVSGLLALAALGMAFSGCRTVVVVGHPGYCHNVPVTVCHHWYDNYGHYHHECGTEWHTHCDATLRAFGTAFGPVGVGQEYGMSFNSADLLIRALLAANSGDYSELANLGLSDADFGRLANFEMPSDAAVAALAKSLDVTTDHARDMLQKIIADTRAAQPRAVNEGTKGQRG